MKPGTRAPQLRTAPFPEPLVIQQTPGGAPVMRIPELDPVEKIPVGELDGVPVYRVARGAKFNSVWM